MALFSDGFGRPNQSWLSWAQGSGKVSQSTQCGMVGLLQLSFGCHIAHLWVAAGGRGNQLARLRAPRRTSCQLRLLRVLWAGLD